MTGKIIWFAAQLSLTAWIAMSGAAWYWVALFVVLDLLDLVGIIGAAARGQV